MSFEQEQRRRTGPIKIVWIDDCQGTGVRESLIDRMHPYHPTVKFIPVPDIPTAEKVIQKQNPNAIISDLQLPFAAYGRHKTTLQFFAHLQENHPELHLAVASGLIDDIVLPGVHQLRFGDPNLSKDLRTFIKTVQRQPRKDEPTKPEKEKQPLRVLYVDDDRMYARTVKRHLKARLGKKIQLTHVSTIYDALQHLKTNPIDVLLSDIIIKLPESLEKLRELSDSMPRNFASGVEFLAYAQQQFGIHPIALSGVRFSEPEHHPGIDFIEKPLLEPGQSSYISHTVGRLYRYKNNPPSRFRILLIDPNKKQARETRKTLKAQYGDAIHVTHINSTHDAFNYLDRKQFHAIIADPFQKTTKDVGFLPTLQRQFQTPVIIHSKQLGQPQAQDHLQEHEFAGFQRTPEGTQQLLKHLGQLIQKFNPTQTSQKIDLNALAAIGPVLHVTQHGKQELIQLVQRDPTDVKVEMIRSGKRYPLTLKQKIDALYQQMKDAPKREQEKLLRMISALEN